MIKAEVHSDDRQRQAEFDATPWFEQAQDIDIIQLADSDFRNDYPADYVAQFVSVTNKDVEAVLSYVEDAYAATGKVGFECSINLDDAMAWLKEHRPNVYNEILCIE